jgi:hypothetical protein
MKKFALLVVVLLLLGSVGLVSAGPNDLPGTGWTSGHQIQNVDSVSNTVVLTAYDENGASYDCGSQVLGSGQSYTYLPASDCTSMPAGFLGSAVASAVGPIAAVVNVNNKSGGGAASGQYNGTDGGAVATNIAFPLVKNDHSGRTTTFYVQNASGNTNTISAAFVVNGTTYNKSYPSVPANAMVVVNPSDAGVPAGNGNVGSLNVTGTGPIAGTSLEHETAPSVANNLQASRAFTPSDYGDTLYCPLVRYNFGGKLTTTGLQIQNVSGSSQTVNVTYTVVAGPSGAGTVIGPVSQVIAAGASGNFLQSSDLQAGDLASAVVEGTGNLAAIVNDKATASNPQRVTTYACFAGDNATSTVNMPLAKEDFGGSVVNTTGIQVQNVGLANTTVTLTYVTNNGDTVAVSHTDPLAPGESKTFYRLANGGTANVVFNSGTAADLDATVSGVVITSSGSQPIVAIANESSLSGAIQDTKNYEGFNQ